MPPKEKKTKKKKEPKSDVFSAICDLKIKQKQKELSEAKEEFDKYQQINKELRQRNIRLTETRERDMARAIEDYRAYNKEINSKNVCDKDQVVEEMKNLWKYKQAREKELLDIRRETKRIEKEISNLKRELKYWIDFKSQGTNMLRTQISLLKKELSEMNENYEIISNSIREKTMSFINQIKQTTEEAIEKKNKTAATKAFKHIDQSIIEMSRENDWMTETIEIYKRDLQNLKLNNSNQEQENIEMMNYLFECNKEELKYVKKIFQTQFFDDENLEQDAIMSIDLTQLASVRLDGSLESNISKIKQINMETKNESHARDSEDEFKFGNYEFKTLSLNGKKKDLIRRKTPTNEEFEAEKFTCGEDWPITQEMLQEIINYDTNSMEYDDDMDIKY